MTKVISPDQYRVIEEDLIQANHKLSVSELQQKVASILGPETRINEDYRPHLNKEDMNAVASSRFLKKTGTKIILLFVALLVAWAMVSVSFRLIPAIAGLAGGAVIIIGFLFLYGKKEAQAKREFWSGIEGQEK